MCDMDKNNRALTFITSKMAFSTRTMAGWVNWVACTSPVGWEKV